MRCLAFIFVVLAAGCGEHVQHAPQNGDTVMVPAFEWRIRSEADIDRLHGSPAYGFTGRDRVTGSAVVYTQQPRHVDDQVACTLGHEVMHLALGSYHK